MRNRNSDDACHSGLIGFIVLRRTCHNGPIVCHSGPIACHSGSVVCHNGPILAVSTGYSVYSGRYSLPPLWRSANR